MDENVFSKNVTVSCKPKEKAIFCWFQPFIHEDRSLFHITLK